MIYVLLFSVVVRAVVLLLDVRGLGGLGCRLLAWLNTSIAVALFGADCNDSKCIAEIDYCLRVYRMPNFGGGGASMGLTGKLL